MTTYCTAHETVIQKQTELLTMCKLHFESTQKTLDTILECLQGQPGAAGLTERVGQLETRMDDLIKVIQGNGHEGLTGRMNKLERIWAALVGVAVASGIAGAGFAKLVTWLW